LDCSFKLIVLSVSTKSMIYLGDKVSTSVCFRYLKDPIYFKNSLSRVYAGHQNPVSLMTMARNHDVLLMGDWG
jgi:hypothetical protein